jgi:hypothetical protein
MRSATDHLITEDEAAAELRKSKAVVRRARAAGLLAYNPGRPGDDLALRLRRLLTGDQNMPRPNKGYQLGDKPNAAGVYEITWSENGRSKRRSTGCENYVDAQKVLASLILLKDRITDPDTGGLTVSEALGDPEAASGEDYWHEHVLPKVIGKDTQRYAIEKLHQHYGPIAIRDLTPQDTLSYIDKRVEGELGHPSEHSTIGRELSVLSAAINHMAEHHAKRIGLVAGQQLPVIHKPVANGPRDRWLTEAEAGAVLTVARGRDKKRLPRVYLFTMLALHTAARSGAIRALTWFQVDLDRKLIKLNPAVEPRPPSAGRRSRSRMPCCRR